MSTEPPVAPRPSTDGPQDSPVWPPAPPTPYAGPPAPYAGPAPADSVAAQPVWTILSSTKRVGRWKVPARIAVFVALGDVRLDLREADLSAQVTTIEVRGLMGEVKVIVPERLRVECTGSTVLGDFESKAAGPITPAPADAPLIRVVGVSVLGSAQVYVTADPVGAGSFAVDGFAGARERRRRRRLGRG